eukprot:jgi/Galph1/1094/GphlegSOOS_G5865.1
MRANCFWQRVVALFACFLLSSGSYPERAGAAVRTRQDSQQGFDVSKLRGARVKLPSQVKKEKKQSLLESPIVKAVPVVIMVSGVGYIGYQAYKLHEKQKVQRWQELLRKQFEKEEKDEGTDSATAEAVVDSKPVSSQKEPSTVGEKSRLEIFHKSTSKGRIHDGVSEYLLPSTESLDNLITRYLIGKITVTELKEMLEGLNETKDQLLNKYMNFCQAELDSVFDKAVKFFGSNDSASIQAMTTLIDFMTKLEHLGKEAFSITVQDGQSLFRYGGVASEAQQEAVYRLLAIHFFSSESRIKDGMEKLPIVQQYLKISSERFHQLNTEVAKAIFQVAVSNAVSDGKLDDESRQALESLRSSFTNMIDQESAENIISEVGLMRVMYALQQLLKEQKFGDEDIKLLRNMCERLGVDLDGLLKTAEAMGDDMGPQVKNFVEQLQKVVSNNPSE